MSAYTCIVVQTRNNHLPRPKAPAQAARTSRPIDRLLDPALFKALSDPTRLRLLAALAKCGRPCAVSEIALAAQVDLSVVSRHLAALEAAGVLDSTKQGRTVSYQVRFAAVADLFRALADALCTCCPGGCCGQSQCNCGCQALSHTADIQSRSVKSNGPGRSGPHSSSSHTSRSSI
jgi:ArsR family transcriptional regulator